MESIAWKALSPTAPFYLFIPQDERLRMEYDRGVSVREMFKISSVGIVTGKDCVLIASNEKQLEAQILEGYKEFDSQFVKDIAYRPFDLMKIYYDTSKVTRPRGEFMRHFLPDSTPTQRHENFTLQFREFIDKKYSEHFSPEQILGYIYAVLFHKDYREKYIDFLKIDFPKIPFVASKEKFLKLSALGQRLIETHLMRPIFEGGSIGLNVARQFKVSSVWQCAIATDTITDFSLMGGGNTGAGTIFPLYIKGGKSE